MSLPNTTNLGQSVDSQRIDHNIRHYFQVFEKEMIRRIQESEDRIRQDIENTNLSKMDKIIELVTQVQIRHFDATEKYEKQSEIFESINTELKALRFELEMSKRQALLQPPMNFEKESYGRRQVRSPSPQMKRRRVSISPPPRFREEERSITPTRHEPNRDCPSRFIISDPRTNEAAHEVQSSSRNKCIYCHYGHFSDECPIVSDACKRKEILRSENRCFRCCGKLDNHVSCNSKECRYCKIIGKTRIDHHSSICRVPLNYYPTEY